MTKNTLSFLTSIFLLGLAGCDGKPAAPASPFEGLVAVEVMKVQPVGGDYVSVRYRVTNQSEVGFVRVKADVLIKDASGASFASRDDHYIVRAAAGGLPAGASLKESTIVKTTEKDRAASAQIIVTYLRDRNGATVAADDPPDGEER